MFLIKKKKKKRKQPKGSFFSFAVFWVYETWGKQVKKKGSVNMRLMIHIKLFILENIFLKIEKIVNTFSISEKNFSKNEKYCVP